MNHPWHPEWRGRREYWEAPRWSRVPEGDVAVGLFRRKHENGWNNYWYLLYRQLGQDQIDAVPVLAQSFLVTPTGSLQNTAAGIDASWNNANNTVTCIGGGGSGGAHSGNGISVGNATGGGGGSFSQIANFVVATPGQSLFQWEIGIGGPTTTATPPNAVAGTAGNSTWFNAASDPGVGTTNAQCSAAGGGAGKASTTTVTQTAAAGGATGASWGQTKFAGGNGGAITVASIAATGGGGAGGTTAAGSQGVDLAAAGASNGGAGGTVSGGALGAGATGTGTQTGGTGGNGTVFDATHGAGGGGGGGRSTTLTGTGIGHGGPGGNYGGAGGGGQGAGTASSTGGAGIQGIIVLTWTPSLLRTDADAKGFPDSAPNPAKPQPPPPELPIERVTPLLNPNPAQPFSQLDWFQIRSTQKAKDYEFPNLLPLLPIPMRAPLFARQPDKLPAARQEYVANLSPLLAPNPAQPFSQNDWYQIRYAQKVKVDDFVNLTPLQSVVVVVGNPFQQNDWFQIRPPQDAGIHDFVNLSPLYIATYPFVQNDWTNPWPQKAKAFGEVSSRSMLAPNPAQPFIQTDWPRPFNPKPVQASDAPANTFPSSRPNPTQPFSQLDWFQIRTTQKAKVDDYVNLLPLQPVVAVNYIFGAPLFARLADPRPKAQVDAPINLTPYLPIVVTVQFQQNDWLNPALPRQKIVDTSIAASAPLYSPNPARPFSQSLWESPARSFGPLTVKSDIYVNLVPLQVANRPFQQNDWPSTALAKPKATGEVLGGDAPLLTPTLVVNYIFGAPFFARLPDRIPLASKADCYGTPIVLFPPPPVITALPHNLHYHVTVGRLKSF